MSTPPNMPPNTPPGGMPPYDPKTQWRVYREQQRAAWRAQRDAWRAQRHAWKAGYVGAYGPRVPSMVGPLILIAVGVVALLVITGRVAASSFWDWYAHWWPLLLIGAGLALLGEWALDMRRNTPVRRTGNFVGLLIFMAILGFSASGWHHMSPWLWQWNNDNGDFFNTFGLPEHDNDVQAINQQIAANATVDIENPRGDISVSAGDGPNLEVQAHEEAFANSDSDATNIWNAEAPHLTVSGTAVLVKSEGNSKGRLNLTVTVPKGVKVQVNAEQGDVTAAGLTAGVTVTAPHGDTHLNAITGPVEAHFSGGKHDFSAHEIDGDITADGDTNDLTLSEIKGRLTLNGEIFGEVHMEGITGPIKLHTSVTDLEVASLPGDLTLDSDDLRVTQAEGAVHVTTHAKDVDLSQIYGDSYVENRDGRISVEPAGSYNIEAKNDKGDVEITLPPNANATVDGHTRNGDIVNDYGLAVSGDEDKTVSGKIGAGGPTIQLSSDNGDLGIKKGPAFPPAPPAPNVDMTAKPPGPAKVPHLRSSKALPAQPVSQ
ncbi:MAG TPA: DUF4097 family beta strand repeat-containing protein [Terracidiphilus sp.]|nr:DUF4097 family beta strand repeat-containing protein [Terracidiphilus sp.]